MAQVIIQDHEEFDSCELFEGFVGQSHLICVDYLANAEREVFELKLYKLPGNYYSFTQTSSFTTETPVTAPCGRQIGTAVHHDLGELKKTLHYDNLQECMEKVVHMMAKRVNKRFIQGI